MKNLCKYAFLFLGMLLMTFSCQKEVFEDSETSQQENFNSNIRINVGNDVTSDVVNYLNFKTNHTLHVTLKKDRIALSDNPITSRESSMGTVDTSKEIVVYNDSNAKHILSIIGNDDPNSLINIVIVMSEDQQYEYFLKYLFDDKPTLTDSNTIDMSVFSGSIETYDDQGQLVGTTFVNHGIFTEINGESSPCNDEEPFDPVDEDPNVDSTDTSGGGEGYGGNDYQSSTDDTGGGSWIDGGPDWQPCTLTNTIYMPCPVQEMTGDTSEEPHNASDCGAGVGSSYIYIWDCDGSVNRQMSEARISENPCDGPVAVLVNLDAMLTDIENCLGEDYSTEWFNNIDDYTIIADIHNYLNGNCNEESRAFMQLAINAIEDHGVVDFENKIIFDASWNDRDCEKSIVLNSTNGFGDISNSIQFLFNNNPNISLTYKTGDLESPPGQLICANTISDFDNNNNVNNISITFNNAFINQATDLMIFSIGLHENLHAILTILLENEMIDIDNDNVNLSYLVEEYANYRANWIINENPEYNPEDLEFLGHEAISDIVEDIATEIKSYGIYRGYDANDFHYEALAWTGLGDTLNFTLLEQDFQDSIEDIIDYETTNFAPLAEGQPCD
ncbi:MAG: hypothetical protein GYB32_00305 [Algicola sp.]|nr:hypothetical protein [Algicola sp.]